MSRLRRCLAAAIVVLGLVLARGAAAEPPIWVVKSRTAEVVLFGSVHVLPPGLAWEPAALKRAIAQADDIWFELAVDTVTQEQTAQLAARIGVLAPDKSLFKLLPADDAERMSRVAQTYDVSPVLLDRLQPWLAEIALAGAAYRKAGADTGSGVEQAIAVQVPRKTRQHAFETPEQQLKIFADTPMDEQVASLHETLKELEDNPGEFQALLRAWMGGDVAGLDREALGPLRDASPDLFRRIVTERNDHWMQVLQGRLHGHGKVVVVVGVGHLVGPGGLPARLRALGYSVQGP